MELININYFKELKNDEAITNYVKKRLSYLEKTSKTAQISVFTGIKSEYITKDSALCTSLIFSKPFFLDDDNLYISFVKFLKRFNKEKTSDNIIDIDVFTNLCSLFILELFYDTSKNTIDRHELYEREGKLSISDFYKNGSAKCFQKSAVIHNLFCFLGVPNYLVIGSLDTLDGKGELHAYNIIKDPKKDLWLMDFQNFIKITNKNNIKKLYQL